MCAINTLYQITPAMAALPPRARAWQQLRVSAALQARVKAYVPASPHFHAHYERWRLYTQRRTDAHVAHYLLCAARWLDASDFPIRDGERGTELQEDVLFNAACIWIFHIERGYELRDIELHLINWNDFDRAEDFRAAHRRAYRRDGSYLRAEASVLRIEGGSGRDYYIAAHDAILSNMHDVEDIDVDYVCRALRRNKIRLTMTTIYNTPHEVWINEAKEDERNASRVVIANFDHETDDEYYTPWTEEETDEAGEAEYENGVLTVVNHGAVDLRSSGPNGLIVDELIAGPRRADVAAAIEQSTPTAPQFELGLAELVAEFGVLDIRDDNVFPRPHGHPPDKRKRLP